MTVSESSTLIIRKFRNDDGSLKGVKFDNEGGPPKITGTGMRYVADAEAEGWITRVNPSLYVAPGGTVDNPASVVHTFVGADELVFHTLDGDVRYKVTRQPGKYLDGKPTQVVGDPRAEVHFDYRLELVEA